MKPLRERWPFRGYCDKHERPLGSYAVLMAVWSAAVGGALLWTRRRRRPLPRLGVGDVVLLGLATHKLTRVAARDWVTSPLRAPFTEFQHSGSAGEVTDLGRGTGLQRAVGDLVSCVFCLGPWVASALTFGFVRWPEQTRLVGGIYALTALSDFLHRGYEWVGAELHTKQAREEAAVAQAELVSQRREDVVETHAPH